MPSCTESDNFIWLQFNIVQLNTQLNTGTAETQKKPPPRKAVSNALNKQRKRELVQGVILFSRRSRLRNCRATGGRG